MDWFQIQNEADIPSPALLIYLERVEENIRRMIAMAGGPERLRPHVKTHKLPQLVEMQQRHGIEKFKCATIAEAEMVAGCGAAEVLVAFQPVGPNTQRLGELARQFPQTRFSCIVDDLSVVERLDEAMARGANFEVLADLDVGMHRSGIEPGPKAKELYQAIAATTNLKPGGLHVYDGHIHMTDVTERTQLANQAYEQAAGFRDQLQASGLDVPRMVIGGTPTYPMHARRNDVELSPGTCVFWDWGYASKFPDMDFLVAAALLTRVASKPAADRLCVDLGHKAIASENPQPRAQFPQLADANPVMHSEEHLVLETATGTGLKVGEVLYAIPRHICPTVALHHQVYVVENGMASDRWPVIGRARSLTI